MFFIYVNLSNPTLSNEQLGLMTLCFVIKFVIKIYDEKIDTRRKATEKELRKKKKKQIIMKSSKKNILLILEK